MQLKSGIWLFLGILVGSLSIFDGVCALAAESPRVGRDAAREYMKKGHYPPVGSSETTEGSYGRSSSTGSHYIGLQVGRFLNSESYEWALTEKIDQVAQTNFTIEYLISQEYANFDIGMRIEHTSYRVLEYSPAKVSVLASWTFPEVETRFPLYFGAALGPGFFVRQLPNESNLTLDYEIYMGLRFLEIQSAFGLSLEGGLKNHLHVLTNGQLNGNYMALGSTFLF